MINSLEKQDTGYRVLLRTVPSFRNLYFGQAISQLGDALYYLVFLFMIEKITGDPRMVGIAGVAQTLPFLLLSPAAGVLADRYDRRAILLFCDFSSATILGILGVYFLFRPAPVALLMATGALLSTINSFFAPAKSAALVQIVPVSKRDSANALSLATQNIMPMIGVALSGTVLGVLYALSSRFFFASAILLNAVSFLISALFLRRLAPLPPQIEDGRDRRSGWRNFSTDLRAGFAYLNSEPILKTLLVLQFLVNLAISPFMLVYVQVNRDWFGGGYGTLALCEVSFFVGVVICSLIVERLRITRPGIAFVLGITGIGLTIAAMAVSKNVLLFALWNLAAGLFFPFAQLPMAGYIQRRVPQELQGRVNSTLGMVAMGVAPLSIGLGGLVLAAIGAAGTIAVMGGLMTLAGLLGLASKSFRSASTTRLR